MNPADARRRVVLAGATVAALTAAPWLFSGCQPAARQSHASHRVEIKALRFVPDTVHVAVGDTVRWANLDLVPHTVTSAAGAFDSGDLPPDSSWTMVVRGSGALDYACRYHPTMKGRVVVDLP